MDVLQEYILATRPWSFTAAIIPVLVSVSVLNHSFLSGPCVKALIMGIFIQAGANLTNTYYDYVNGMDGKNSVCGDRTLVDKKLTPTSLFIFSIICYFIGIMSIVSLLIDDHDRKLSTIFFIGLLLSICYTANPVGLKYKALGDVTIFLCFGPLLMQCTSIILNNKATNELYYYSIPIGLLTECILHANNARDIKADIACGATTLASLVGIEMSYILFIAFIFGSYISIIFISAYYHYGCMLTFLTIPLAIDLIKKFNDKKMTNLPEEAAKMHLPFGLLLVIGILISPTGFY